MMAETLTSALVTCALVSMAIFGARTVFRYVLAKFRPYCASGTQGEIDRMIYTLDMPILLFGQMCDLARRKH